MLMTRSTHRWMVGLFCVMQLGATENAAAQTLALRTGQQPAQEMAGEKNPDTQRILQIIRSFGHQASAPAQLIQLTRDVEAGVAAPLFLQVAEETLASGQIDLAANILQQLITQYPQEPAATTGTVLLIRLFSSGELAYVWHPPQDAARQMGLPDGWQESAQEKGGNFAKGSLVYALHLAKKQMRIRPKLAEHPPLVFQCAVAARLSAAPQEAKSWLALLKHRRGDANWRRRALAESWLAESHGENPPLPIVPCRIAKTPPHLDGKLDETFWQTANPSPLAPRSSILFAYDKEYLYLAARCEKIADVNTPADTRPRTPDADLSSSDHVRFFLDIDRDYATYYDLSIDHRGRTADACWKDPQWNPRWFVAAGGDLRNWTCEAAIPWQQLTATAPTASDSWAVAIQRIAPDAKPKTPNYSLLLFQ